MFEDIPRLEDLGPLAGRSVLVRADLNVPLRREPSGAYEVADQFRIVKAVPTLVWLRDRGAAVTVASHLGRPKGKVDEALRMEPVRRRLAMLVPGVEVLENLRFDPGEEAGDPAFGARLVQGHDCFVNDAFGACHRAHASIVYPPTVLSSASGLLLATELAALGRIIDHPARPFTVVAGGLKVVDKLATLRALAGSADRMAVGGAMALTFLAATGRRVGDSPVEAPELGPCRSFLALGTPVTLPTDLVAVRVTDDHAGPGPADVDCFTGDVPKGWRVVDIGPDSRQRFVEQIEGSAALLWNGPMGVFEEPAFAEGTRVVAEAIAGCGGFTVVGGGDTVSAVRSFGLGDAYGHLSTGGGAMLELVRQGDLPGISALRAAGARQRGTSGVTA
jgi:phosphoglycerate kinase